MTTLTLYPFRRPIIAKAMPVLPLVGSRMVLSFVSSPLRSACSIIYFAIRSLRLPVGLFPSILAKIRTPCLGVIRGSSSKGVFPMASRISTLLIHVLVVGIPAERRSSRPLHAAQSALSLNLTRRYQTVPRGRPRRASRLPDGNGPVGVVQHRDFENLVPFAGQAPRDILG